MMNTTTNEISTEKLEKVAFILKSIGHPIRLGIIKLLTSQKEMSVNDIGKDLAVEQSLLSHHLNNMKLKGILQNRRNGKNIFYCLKMKEVTTVIECMSKCDL